MTFRELRLRALMADNDFRHAARTGAHPDEIKRLWVRKELWRLRLHFAARAAELGPRYNFWHELRVLQRERRAA